ncbi:MAG: hypothetical protein FWH29_05065 [Methanobrevibacter sp.]|nr:hypothetical protein [Methanobrevibacter sp.]
MIALNKSSLLIDYDDLPFKFFFDSETNTVYLNEDTTPDLVILVDYHMKKKCKVVYLKSLEKCPICDSDLNKNGTNKFLLNKDRIIRKQKYVCKNKKCNKHSQACLKKFIDKHCNYTKDIRESGLNISLIGYLSYEKMSDLIEFITGTKIPRSTLHYHVKGLSGEYLDKKEKEIAMMMEKLGIEPQGVYHYDEQVLWVNTDIKLRMTIIDAENNMVINDEVVDGENFNKYTIKKFLNDSLKGLKIEAIITDGHRAYPSIIETLGAIHQKCVFHKMQTLMKHVYKTMRKLNNKITRCENDI